MSVIEQPSWEVPSLCGAVSSPRSTVFSFTTVKKKTPGTQSLPASSPAVSSQSVEACPKLSKAQSSEVASFF
jgi:hypothetical protein